MVPGFEMLVWWATVKTPGQSHRQKNYFFLKTSPVNSLLWVGSGNCLSFTWDRLSVLCQQLSPSTRQEEGCSQEAARWPRGLRVSHQPVKECLPYAVPELPAAQLESTPVASRLGTQGARGSLPKSKGSPCRCSRWGGERKEEEVAGLVSGSSFREPARRQWLRICLWVKSEYSAFSK